MKTPLAVSFSSAAHWICAACLVVLGCLPPAVAAVTGAGTIEGVVSNSSTRRNLENARVRIEGSGRETFTDPDGRYRLSGVPAGDATLQVAFTGMEPRSEVVAVESGRTTVCNFDLDPVSVAGANAPVRLSQYVVEESREIDATAFAINEQRVAPNIKNVIAAGEFGSVADGDIGELLKLTPGITVEYAAGDARRVGLDGVNADYVPVTIGGFSLAHTVQGGTSRGVELNQVSLNNISRVEVVQSPTPESPGGALAGSINFIPRSAFELSKPSFVLSTYVTLNDEVHSVDKTRGQHGGPKHTILPGVELSYVRPVNARLGFTISASASDIYSPRNSIGTTWRGAGAVTNGTTFPDTTPDLPYLTDFSSIDGPFMRRRHSVAFTVDYKLSPTDRISLSLDRSYFGSSSNNHTIGFEVGRVLPGNFSPTHTHGAAGAGTIRLAQGQAERDAYTTMPTLTYRHDGPVWRAETGLGYSHAKDVLRAGQKGYFNSVAAQRTGVTVHFDEIRRLAPGRVTVTDATGNRIDPYDLNSYVLTTAGTNDARSSDAQRTAFANLRREFDWKIPVVLKGGLDVRNSVRDIRRDPTSATTYVGVDRIKQTIPAAGDDDAGPFLNQNNVGRVGIAWDFPESPTISNELLWQEYLAHPERFTFNAANDYVTQTNNSKRAEETISAAFLRADVSLFRNRLKLIGGLRGEQTNIKAEGPLADPTRNFQRNAAGQVIRGANGQPLPLETDPLRINTLTRINRGQHVQKEYLRWFPSINAAYSVRENLIARAAFYTSVGRPNFNQYAGGLTLPNLDNPPAANNRITVNNAGIKAWSAESFKVSLEYYFKGVGLLSAGAFRRDFQNFFGTVVSDVTPDFLALYGLEADEYGGYQISTQHNVPGKVRMDGYNVNYKQALTFLPDWARGVQVFANMSVQRAMGDESANFDGYIPRTVNWGVSLSRAKYDLRLNWNHRSKAKLNQVNGRGISPGTFAWSPSRLYLDIAGEYRFLNRYSVFAKLRNFGAQDEGTDAYGPDTPDGARQRALVHWGSQWTIGARAKF